MRHSPVREADHPDHLVLSCDSRVVLTVLTVLNWASLAARDVAAQAIALQDRAGVSPCNGSRLTAECGTMRRWMSVRSLPRRVRISQSPRSGVLRRASHRQVLHLCATLRAGARRHLRLTYLATCLPVWRPPCTGCARAAHLHAGTQTETVPDRTVQ